MRSIPLYEPNLLADASHDVRAPGGYEWWYFDAEDRASDTQIVAIYLHGFVFHPGYLRAIARYQRRPTRTAPPVPGDFPCAYFCVYRNGRILHQFMTQVAPRDYAARMDVVDVRIGENRLSTSEGSLHLQMSGSPWKLTWQGPKTDHSAALRADLRFAPTFPHAPAERVFLSRAMTGAEHHWVIANPHCAVEGTIHVDGAEPIRFSGTGYHDHNYGAGPLGHGLARWIWGRAMLDDQVVTFHHAIPRSASLPPETHLVHTDASGITEIPIQRTIADWSARTLAGLRYPRQLSLDDTLVLIHARIIDSAPFYMRLIYDAQVRGRSTTAFCEIAYPHRLRYPVLGRMIEMSIDKRL